MKVHLYRPFSIKHFMAAIPATCQEDRRARPHQGTRLSGRAAVSGCVRCAAGGRQQATSRSSAAATAWAPRNSTPPWSRRFTTTWPGRAEEPLHRRHQRRCDRHRLWNSAKRWTSRPRAPCPACSTAWAPTAPLAPTRTPSRSSATTPTSTRRRTSRMTPRSPAASPSAICASAIRPSSRTYLIDSADFIACHNPSYVTKYDMVSALKDGGVFLLNCPWTRRGAGRPSCPRP